MIEVDRLLSFVLLIALCGKLKATDFQFDNLAGLCGTASMMVPGGNSVVCTDCH